MYQELIGELLYLANRTRPDIIFVMSYLSQFNHNPEKRHYHLVKRVLRYLMGSKDKKLFYENEFGILNASSDASWGNAENGKSFSGGVVLLDRWIPRGVSFQRPRHRLIAVASLGRLPRNRSIPVWFTRYPRTALSDRWRSLGITSLMNIGGIRYVHIHSYIGHHDQACVLACKIQCISKFHEIKLKS
ncbi:retrovirus-related Pol polyprotein from transposon TNT 1-94 [Trichonephila clavipes]|nr:retrovirus-related Pol polyprotein from transposon TNT 1-94 [Trichonephila clavipes]